MRVGEASAFWGGSGIVRGPFDALSASSRPFDVPDDIRFIDDEPAAREPPRTPGEATHRILLAPKPTFPLKYELQRGPEGMKIDENGPIAWDVPDTGEAAHEIVVRITHEAKKIDLADTSTLRVLPAALKP